MGSRGRLGVVEALNRPPACQVGAGVGSASAAAPHTRPRHTADDLVTLPRQWLVLCAISRRGEPGLPGSTPRQGSLTLDRSRQCTSGRSCLLYTSDAAA